MPSEYSIYRKIQVVLDVAKSVEVATSEALREHILKRKYTNFETRQYEREKDDFVLKQSERVIRRTVAFCHILGLIGSDGHLTEEGRNAVRKAKFDKIIAAQIRLFLHRKEVNLSDLNNIILDSLKSDPPILPTCKELWNAIGGRINYSSFSRMLTLLSQSGGALSSQKKIYLLIHPE